jgi:hypothetical protein
MSGAGAGQGAASGPGWSTQGFVPPWAIQSRQIGLTQPQLGGYNPYSNIQFNLGGVSSPQAPTAGGMGMPAANNAPLFTPPSAEQVANARSTALSMQRSGDLGSGLTGFTESTKDDFMASQPLMPGGAARSDIAAGMAARGVPQHVIDYFMGAGGFNASGRNAANSGFLYEPVPTPEQGGPPLTDFSNPTPPATAGDSTSLRDAAGNPITAQAQTAQPEEDIPVAQRFLAQTEGPSLPMRSGNAVSSSGDSAMSTGVRLINGTYYRPDGSAVSPEELTGGTMGGGIIPPGTRTPTSIPATMPGPGGGGSAGGSYAWDPNIFDISQLYSPNEPGGLNQHFGSNKTNPAISSQGAPGLSIAQDAASYMEQFHPGLLASIPDNFAGFDTDNRANIYNYLAGIYANDPGHLSGGAAGNILGAAQNMTQLRAGQQDAAGGLALQNLGRTVGQVQTGPVAQGGYRMASDIMADPYVTSNAGVQADIEGILRRRYGAMGEATRQSAADASAAAGRIGGESALINAGADMAARSRMADAMANARVEQALRMQNDRTAATAQLGQLSDIQRDTVLGPEAMLAEATVNRYNNPYFNSYIEQMRQLGLLALEDERLEAGSKMGVANTALGGGLGAGGQIFGGLLSGAGQAGGFSNLFT